MTAEGALPSVSEAGRGLGLAVGRGISISFESGRDSLSPSLVQCLCWLELAEGALPSVSEAGRRLGRGLVWQWDVVCIIVLLEALKGGSESEEGQTFVLIFVSITIRTRCPYRSNCKISQQGQMVLVAGIKKSYDKGRWSLS